MTWVGESVDLRARVRAVRTRIDDAAARRGRDPSTVRLVAVTKAFPADVVRAALDAGIVDMGENRAQELKEKMAAVGADARWHFIGPLQTNKAKIVTANVVLVHSVDRSEVAEAIARRARAIGATQDILIEVNVAGDPAKHGVDRTRAVGLAREVDALEGIRVKGLMTMPPYPEDAEESRPYYRSLAELGAVLIDELPGAGELSMGMTRDFEVAVEEGATLVRVGEAIFGPRRRA